MTFIVPAVLGGLAIVVMALVSVAQSRKGKHPAAAYQQQYSTPQHRVLIHSINNDRCTGCDACVAVCPTNVLDLVDNKSKVLRFEDCIQCEQCMWACPTTALVMHLEGTEPPPYKMPELDEFFQTVVPGQYLIGEVSGKPLVKNAANLGRMVVEHMLSQGGLRSMGASATPNRVDVAIVGSGPGGLSTALSCIRRGLSYVILEKEQILASTISRYPKGKFVMAEPYDVHNYSLLPVYDSSKEQLIACWQDLIDRVNLKINKGEPVEEITKGPDGMFAVRTTVAAYQAQRVVMSIGTRGKPRTLGVPGENLPKVHSMLDDPDEFRGKPVIVTGGGDSAVEAAMALADAGAKVVLSYRGKSFNRCAPKNKQAIESYDAQKRVKVRYQSNIVQFTEDKVTIEMGDGSKKTYPNAAAFVLIGAVPPVKWLSKMSIQFVDRPHMYQLGNTDQMLKRFLGNEATLCPEDAVGASEMVLHGRVRSAASVMSMPAPPQPEVSKPRKWLRNATQMFSAVAFGKDNTNSGVSLSDFASNQRKHSGRGRRDALPAAERTRILRMLRDEGGRIAYDESRLDIKAVPPRNPYEPETPPPDFHSPVHGAEPDEATVMASAMQLPPDMQQYIQNQRQKNMQQQQGYGQQQQGYGQQQQGYGQQRQGYGQQQQGYGQQGRSGNADASLANLLRNQQAPSYGGGDFGGGHDEATRVANPVARGADVFEEPTRAALPGQMPGQMPGHMSGQPGYGGGHAGDFGSGFADHEEATRAVDMAAFAAGQPSFRPNNVNQVPPPPPGSGNPYDEATRAVDLSNYDNFDRNRPESLSDVDWDLD